MDATQASNSKTRGEVLKSSLERLYQADREIADLIESSGIKELRAEKSDIFTRLRDEFQMPSALVRARYTAFKFERAAQDGADDITADAIREMFSLVPIGGMVNMLDALEKATPAPEQAGYKAQGNGFGRDDNPHDPGTSDHFDWDTGWMRSLTVVGDSLYPGKKKRGKKPPEMPDLSEDAAAE